MGTKDNRNLESAILAHGYKAMWLKQNRCVFAVVAKQLSKKKHCSKQFVRMVYWGERRSRRVERAFRRLRAPGFESDLKVAA